MFFCWVHSISVRIYKYRQIHAPEANRRCVAVAMMRPKPPPTTTLFHMMMLVYYTNDFRSTVPQLTEKWQTNGTNNAHHRHAFHYVFVDFIIFCSFRPKMGRERCRRRAPKWIEENNIFTIALTMDTASMANTTDERTISIFCYGFRSTTRVIWPAAHNWHIRP